MKAYGSQRSDFARCAYGCCGGKLMRFKLVAGCYRRSCKKKARRAGRKEALTD